LQDIILVDLKKEKEYIFIKLVAYMREIFKKMKEMEMDIITMKMEIDILESCKMD